jgi:hypothetical protein
MFSLKKHTSINIYNTNNKNQLYYSAFFAMSRKERRLNAISRAVAKLKAINTFQIESQEELKQPTQTKEQRQQKHVLLQQLWALCSPEKKEQLLRVSFGCRNEFLLRNHLFQQQQKEKKERLSEYVKECENLANSYCTVCHSNNHTYHNCVQLKTMKEFIGCTISEHYLRQCIDKKKTLDFSIKLLVQLMPDVSKIEMGSCGYEKNPFDEELDREYGGHWISFKYGGTYYYTTEWCGTCSDCQPPTRFTEFSFEKIKDNMEEILKIFRNTISGWSKDNIREKIEKEKKDKKASINNWLLDSQ